MSEGTSTLEQCKYICLKQGSDVYDLALPMNTDISDLLSEIGGDSIRRFFTQRIFRTEEITETDAEGKQVIREIQVPVKTEVCPLSWQRKGHLDSGQKYELNMCNKGMLETFVSMYGV